MKTFALMLASGAIALFVLMFANTYVDELKFSSHAVPVEVTIDRVTAERKYVTVPRTVGVNNPYHWDVVIMAHDGSKKWLLLDPVCQDVSEVQLLLGNQGKRMVLWVLPKAEFSTRYSLKNGFPTKSLLPLMTSVLYPGHAPRRESGYPAAAGR